ncbi:polyketide synthase [Talaromyces proteolyticus]|uniref:Polyketide synthase n=1 Tax=Talaromyces proteolyticus TaxID=1131652 RepID=A0AAD4KN83_9EURO|nr:polyketide synthase [Talaromyces proteolyticus]KAH8693010.1 polyketide synthase [Talaromyces proteolyticus]
MNGIAVIGMACRLPGGVNSPNELWQMILETRDGSGEISSNRWEPWARRDPRNPNVLEEITKKGYFLDNLGDFDPAFFGVSPKEAEQMDPQQRLVLEVSWEALERAGVSPNILSGSDTGVYIGVNSDDYSRLLLGDLPNVEPWMGIGTAYCGVPNRLSYQLNLMGPSMAVDAACASSLAAVHLGKQAILQGECKLAIVGGVNALCSPEMTAVLAKSGATSKEGICQSFDDAAHGYGRGEGAAIIILKHLDEAINDGDNIDAIIKGSAVAQDGRTNGIMAPNANAQELVARKALDDAGVDSMTINYVEAHATSTALGDVTEISAISRVYGGPQRSESPCYIGSVKANVGHLEAGAGAVGLIRAVMSISTGIIPPQAGLKQLNSNINWSGAGLNVPQNAQTWPNSKSPRRAGVCSYGYGGTVSHLIVEQYIPPASNCPTTQLDSPQILLLSVPQEKRMSATAEKLSSWVHDDGEKYALASIATTLATRRAHHKHRAALVADDHHDAVAQLKSLAKGVSTEWIAQNRALSKGTRRGVTFVFSGHGSQWADMGKELLKEPVFRDIIVSLDPIVKDEIGFSALDALRKGDFEASDTVQVLIYLMQVGLMAILKSRGLQPDAVIGHSVGEVAAAVAAGCLTPQEGALVVTKRAKLYQRFIGTGAMAVVYKPFDEIQKELGPRTDIVAAIDSSPSSCVLSGDRQSLETFCHFLNGQGVKSMWVKSDISFHHPNLTELVKPLACSLDDLIAPRVPKVAIYSTSQNDPCSRQPRDIDYWCQNMVQPVKLRSAVAAAAKDGLRVFLEISPHPIVSHFVQETLMSSEISDPGVYHTMRRHKPAEKTILYSLAQLHCHGCDIKWNTVMKIPWTPEVPLTGWYHQMIWKDVETTPFGTAMTHSVERHALLGSRLSVAGEDIVTYSTNLDKESKPFPGNHPIQGSEIIPAAVLINTFLLGTGALELSKFHLRIPISTEKPRDIQFVVSPGHAKICSRLVRDNSESQCDDNSWQTHTTGCWSTIEAAEMRVPYKLDIKLKKAVIGQRLSNTFSVDYLSNIGVSSMGFPWIVLEHFGNQDEMIALVDVAPEVDRTASLPWDPHSWAPILDSATSVGSTLFASKPRLRMPSHVERISVLTKQAPPKVCHLHVKAVENLPFAAHINVYNEQGDRLVCIESMQFSELEGNISSNAGLESLVHQIAWPPAIYNEMALPFSNIVLISRDSALAHLYRESLSSTVLTIIVLDNIGELLSRMKDLEGDTAVVYLPTLDPGLDSIATAAYDQSMDLINIARLSADSNLSIKIYVLTNGVFIGQLTALAQSTLTGLSRIIASEHPDIWGALIDLESTKIPIEVMKYVQGEDVIRISDGIPRVARLRPLSPSQLLPRFMVPQLSSPDGTYLITGGLGVLGLATAEFLVQLGARRLILVSRRGVPPRKSWPAKITESSPMTPTLQKLQHLEAYGATIKTLVFDIGSSSGPQLLSDAIDALNFPPICGVIHAAGVLEDELILSITAKGLAHVLSPKVSGAILLHRLFPPKTLNFMAFFSSCGQLFGFPGQGSYAAGNAFLDALATHRRDQGDNTISFQWSSWRGMGMSTSTGFIDAELANKGITDITRDEALQAFMHAWKYDTSQVTVLRSLPIEHDEPIPIPILTEIIKRKALASTPSNESSSTRSPADLLPPSKEERRSYLDHTIRGCLSQVLHLSGPEEVDSKAVMSDLGLDSVLTVTLRGLLGKATGVNVPPTLTWACPTVLDLVSWFETRA